MLKFLIRLGNMIQTNEVPALPQLVGVSVGMVVAVQHQVEWWGYFPIMAGCWFIVTFGVEIYNNLKGGLK